MSLRFLTSLVAAGVLLGAASAASARVAVDFAVRAPDLRIEGGLTNNDLGTTLVAGDVNGDGVADLVVADATPRNMSGSEAGQTFVFLGGSDFFSSPTRLASTADTRIYSAMNILPMRSAGVPVVGDVNGDGIADIAIGSPPAHLGCGNECGGSWVVLGRSTWPASIDLAASAHWTFRGGGLLFGPTSLIDLDGDGRDDVLIGQPMFTTANGTSSGRILAYFASRLVAGQFIDTTRTPADREILGHAASAGAVVASAVDLDDDGQGEALVPSGTFASARAFGTGSDLPAGPTINLADATRLAVLSDPVTANATSFVARRDFDGDGQADELTTSSRADSLGRTGNGLVSVRFAAPTLALGDARDMGPATADWIAHGPVSNGFARGLMVGDVTGDGRPDLAVRVVETPTSLASLLVLPVGRASCATGATDVDLATAADVLAFSATKTGDFLGSSLAVADFDGDGIADIALGAPDADGEAVNDQLGSVFVMRGVADWDGDGLSGADDCAPFDATLPTIAVPLDLRVSEEPATTLTWTPAPPGPGVVTHVLGGLVSELRADRGFSRARALAKGLSTNTWTDMRPGPGAGDAWWYLTVAQDQCGFSPLGPGAGRQDLAARLCDLVR